MHCKLLTLNIHKGYSSFNRRFILHELRDAVRDLGADIVFLQEVLGDRERHGRGRSHSPTTSQYEFLADSIWSEFAYGRNAVYTSGHHGNAVLSKFPILRYFNHDISVRGRDRRGLLHCVLQVPGLVPELHAICVHLGLTGAHRSIQLTRLCDLIAKAVPKASPLLVAGDFNDWRAHAGPILKLGAGLQEVFLRADGRGARTFPVRWPMLRLDRIYLRNAHALQSRVLSEVPWSRLSDHAGLTADVSFTEELQRGCLQNGLRGDL